MSVTHVATGAKSSGGTTTVSIASPSGTAAGQILLAGRAAWVSGISFTDETDWTASGSLAGGTGASADAHTSAIRVDRRVLAGSLAGPTVFDQTFGGGGSGCIGIMLSYEHDGSSFDVATATGDDATHGTNRSVTSSTNIDLAAGDVVVVFVATDTDTDLASFANQAITASGITFGSTTRRTSGAGVTTGSDGNIEVFEATVSSGSGTVAVTLAFDTATNQCGPAAFIRLREISGTPATATPSAIALSAVLDSTTEKGAAVVVPSTIALSATIPAARGNFEYPGGLPYAAVIAWYDARELAGSASDPVASWEDLGPLFQDPLAEATNRPVISDSGFDGVRSVQFDGTNDQLNVTLDQSYTGDFAIIIALELLTYPTGSAAVAYSTGSVPNKNILGVDDVEDPPGWVVMSGDGSAGDHHHGTADQTYLEDVPSRFVMTQYVENDNRLRLWENSVLVIDEAPASATDLNNMGALKLGAREDNSRFMNCRIGAVLLIDAADTNLTTILAAATQLEEEFNVGGDATVEPATIALSAVLDATTEIGAAVVTPATIALAAVLDTPTVGISADVQPPVIALAVVMDATTESGGAVVSPPTIALVVVLDTPTIDAGTSATVNPPVIALAVVLDATTEKGGAVGTPGTIALVVVLDTPTIDAGEAETVTPATIALAVVLDTPAVHGAAVVNPTTIALAVVLPTPTIEVPDAVVVTPATIALNVVLWTPSILGGVITTPVPVGYWLEVWRRPGAADFARVIDSPPFRESSYHIGVGLVGDGSMSLPDTYDRFDDILDIANEVGSLVRLREDETGRIVGEWIPSSITPVADKNDPFVEVGGRAMNEIMEYAVAEANDWDGSDNWASLFSDWVWGGPNLMTNAGLEDSNPITTRYILEITATGGTFTLTDGVDTTPSFSTPFAGLALSIESELENFDGINDAVVVRTSSSPITYLIEIFDPTVGVELTVNTGSLTGGTATLELDRAGSLDYAPWDIAKALIAGAIGDVEVYDAFEVSSEQAHTGSYSLKIDPSEPQALANRNGGAQQVISVQPGGTYQASIWIYPTNGSDTFRLAIYTDGEEVLAGTGAAGDTYPANTWTQISLPDIEIPAGITTVIFRIQCTNEAGDDPDAFYVDDAAFTEGYVAATVGEIIRILYEDATVDHIGVGRLVWEDEANPGTPYLTLDFDDDFDSAGNLWFNSAVSIRIWMRMTYLQMLEALEGQEGIEWRVVPADPVTGTGGWLLQVYNEGWMDGTPGVAIQGGSQDTRRALRRFRPNSAWLVEGEERLTARSRSGSGFGRIESARLDRTAPTIGALALEADQDRANADAASDVWSYELTNPYDAPLYHYTYGDSIIVHDPPDVDDTGRVWEMNLTLTPELVQWDVDILKPEPGEDPPAPGGLFIFLEDDIFDWSAAGFPETLDDVWVIAGGGGGGRRVSTGWHPGGGGAGGVLHLTDYPISGDVAVVVGLGGSGGVSGSPAQNGQPSSFDGQVATGGGRGGSATQSINGGEGGSGGGAASSSLSSGSGGNGLQGSDGGASPAASSAGGGGGGFSEVGAAGNSGVGGDGGDGLDLSAVVGTSYGEAGWFAGGGGARGGTSPGVGGQGGGGNGSTAGAGQDALENSGGGGGSGTTGFDGGDGGSGIVIVRIL